MKILENLKDLFFKKEEKFEIEDFQIDKDKINQISYETEFEEDIENNKHKINQNFCEEKFEIEDFQIDKVKLNQILYGTDYEEKFEIEDFKIDKDKIDQISYEIDYE